MMQVRALAFLGAALVAGGFACGSSSNGNNTSPQTNDAGEDSSSMADTGSMTEGGGNEAAADAEPAPYPAVIPTDVPQVANAGGPVMKAPKIVPIFYASDDMNTVASLKDFLSKLPASQWWAGWTKEYGIGAISIADAIVLTDSLPPYWDDSQIQADLQSRLASSDGGAGEFPAPDANTIYTYFFPPGVTITTSGTPDPTDGGAFDAGSGFGDSCTGFGGYHDNITLTTSNMDVAYAVVPRCASFGPLMGIDAITGPASHEISEASSDPFPSTNPAYSTVDAAHFYWSRVLGGGEIGDMCAQEDSSFTKWPDLPYVVQREWSNAAAKAGTDPCVPVPKGDVYFQSYPKMTDTISLNFMGTMVSALGADIAVGSSKTVELDLSSSAPTSGPWQVRVFDTSSSGTQYLGFAFQECNGAATCTGQNGAVLHMTITVIAAGRRGYEPFYIESRYAADGGSPMAGDYQLWAGLVGGSSDGGTGGPKDSGGGG